MKEDEKMTLTEVLECIAAVVKDNERKVEALLLEVSELQKEVATMKTMLNKTWNANVDLQRMVNLLMKKKL